MLTKEIMRKFTQFILAAVMLFGSMLASAESVDISHLPEEAKAEILAKVAAAKPPAATMVQTNAEIVGMAQSWVSIGQGLGAGIVAAAKELGVAANDFATTDLGKIVIFLLVWKLMGAQLMGTALGLALIVSSVWIGLRMVKTSEQKSEMVEYGQFSYLFGLFSIRRVIRKEVKRGERLSESQITKSVVGYLLMTIGSIVGLVVVF